MRRLILFLIALLVAAPAMAAPAPARAGAILIYSGTTGYRHESIPAGIKAVSAMAARRGLTVVASEDPSVFSSGQPETLPRDRPAELHDRPEEPSNPNGWSATGELRSSNSSASGGGIVAIHAAADFALSLALVRAHDRWPLRAAIRPAHPRDRSRSSPRPIPSCRACRAASSAADEWYYFDDYDPVSKVLVTLDPSSIGEKDINPNPVAWTRQINDGRIFYTAMGHTTESYSEPFFLQHVANGLDWVLRR